MKKPFVFVFILLSASFAFAARVERLIDTWRPEHYLVNITLAEFERRLDPKRFRRVHRSVIVNLDKIVTCKTIDRRLHLELSDGSRVTASRAGSQDLRKLFCK